MEIKAFQGWRYSVPSGAVSGLIAPPYDVLSCADKDALLAANPRNVVAVDLPHCPPSDVGPDAVYQQSAATLREWQSMGVLRRDERPCLYAYQQDFTWAGQGYSRRAIIAAVRLQPFGQGVWPHEKTFAGPKADRLRLMQTTGTQLSPILGFYPGAAGAVDALFAAAGGVAWPVQTWPRAENARCHATLGGVTEQLWAIDDPAALAKVTNQLVDVDLFIADGHHRYTTALNYRDSLGRLPAGHPANYVMFVLVSAQDPGLIILPTHRVFRGLAGFDMDRFMQAGMEVMEYKVVHPSLKDFAAPGNYLGEHEMLFASPHDGGVIVYRGRLKDPAIMDRLAAEELPAWRALDVSILHRLLVDQYLAACKTDQTKIEYLADGSAALAAVQQGGADLAVFLGATPLQSVIYIALAGTVMPHKSTYFYPKPATGMVFYSLT